MDRPKALVAMLLVAVVILGPTMFMASSPCVDCDGVCGVGVTLTAVHVAAVILALPLTPESLTPPFSTSHRPSPLPPRPLATTV